MGPERHLTYADERGRPFVELLQRVGAEAPARVVDLGCGAGNLTRLLRERWPDAEVTGLDSSPEMIARARADITGTGVEVGDLRDWAPAEPVDVIVSNATLQWLPDHLEVLARLVGQLRTGGWLAFQVPGNFDEPSHTQRDELAAQPPYAAHTTGVAVPSSHDPATYLDGLGMTEVEKPADLRARGGAWFRSYDGAGEVAAEIHVGVEDPFRLARKAHPAFVLGDRGELEATVVRLAGLGFDVDWGQRDHGHGDR